MLNGKSYAYVNEKTLIGAFKYKGKEGGEIFLGKYYAIPSLSGLINPKFNFH